MPTTGSSSSATGFETTVSKASTSARIVPERTVFAAVEPPPDLVADGAQVREDGAGAVKPVRSGDEPHVLGLAGNAGHVRLFPLPPVQLGVLEGVGVASHFPGHLLAESSLADVFEPPLAALVLGGVLQQCGDDLVLCPAVLADDRRRREQVRNVGYVLPIARLIQVNPGSVFDIKASSNFSPYPTIF